MEYLLHEIEYFVVLLSKKRRLLLACRFTFAACLSTRRARKMPPVNASQQPLKGIIHQVDIFYIQRDFSAFRANRCLDPAQRLPKKDFPLIIHQIYPITGPLDGYSKIFDHFCVASVAGSHKSPLGETNTIFFLVTCLLSNTPSRSCSSTKNAKEEDKQD